jgi:hypothetical protein
MSIFVIAYVITTNAVAPCLEARILKHSALVDLLTLVALQIPVYRDELIY